MEIYKSHYDIFETYLNHLQKAISKFNKILEINSLILVENDVERELELAYEQAMFHMKEAIKKYK